jgi:nucleoside-diphosphate-sugar epimerase
MTALVTGGGGFIGSRLVSYLAEWGMTVHVLDLPGSIRSQLRRENVRHFPGDILEYGLSGALGLRSRSRKLIWPQAAILHQPAVAKD